jgi:hypothetical protein
MLNPEYVDPVENDPSSLKLGFTSDGQNVVEIVIRIKDAHRFGMMLIHKYNERRKREFGKFDNTVGRMPKKEYIAMKEEELNKCKR